MLEKLTLDAVLGALKKAWPFLIIGALGVMLAITRGHLDDARKALADEAQFRHTLQVRTQAKSASQIDLYAQIDAALVESANRKVTLETISHDALSAKQRADAADAQLKREQAEFTKRFAAAQAQINALDSRKSTGNRDADWLILEKDTQAPWKDWK